ncbi:hypothetical protein D3C85_815990 [compost metagenome]
MDCTESEIGGPGAHPEEAEIEAEFVDGLRRRDIDGAADHIIQLPADQNGLDALSLQEPRGNGRAVGHHRQAQLLGQDGGQ